MITEKWNYVVFCLLIAGISLCFLHEKFQNNTLQEKKTQDNSMFSWHSDALYDENRKILFETMEELDLLTIYQSIPRSADLAVVHTFLKEASEKGISVYLLTGSPTWGLDSEGTKMIKEVRWADKIKRTLDSEGAFKGIVMDTEPYLTDEWKDNRKRVMRNYVSGMEAAYKEAKICGLQFNICTPYYYDTIGFEDLLKRLISDCCDEILVMNYFQGKEAKHIETELALAKQYKKSLTNIYELQPAGVHGLKEENTYYDDGIEELLNNWLALKEQFSYANFSYALHDYTVLLEVLKHE